MKANSLFCFAPCLVGNMFEILGSLKITILRHFILVHFKLKIRFGSQKKKAIQGVK